MPETETEKTEKKPNKKRKKWGFLLWGCIVVFVLAVLVIILYVVKLNRSADTYEELAETAHITEAETEETEEETEEETTTKEPVDIPIDFETLWEQNEDIYAWIYIEDTVIDYPILQSEDDDQYYLNHTVDNVSGYPGSIYTHASYNSTDMMDYVTVIYGHNMKNGSMFGSLSDYLDEEFREEHSEIIIYTPEHIFTYEVVCAVTYTNWLIPYYFDITTEEGYADFLISLQTDHYIPTWTSDTYDFSTDTRMIILSTCNSNSSQRLLIGAALVNEE